MNDARAQSPADIDVVWTSAYGLSNHRGGSVFFTDEIGLKTIVDGLTHFGQERRNKLAYWTPSSLLAQLARGPRTAVQLEARRMTGAALDLGALGDYLQREISGFRTPCTAARFSGGQSNPTYCITDAIGSRYVLRKKPAGTLLPSAHAVDREYRVMKALQGSEVPVPHMLCFCEDAAVIGTPFYLMEHIEGRILWDPALPEVGHADRAPLYDEMSRVVAALHRLDYQAVGLGEFGRPGNFVRRQVDRWTKQYQATATEPIAAMDRLIEWLPQHLPADEATTVFHGDLRLDNLIFHPTEPRVLAVLDWELSTLGHPLADFAYHMLPWRLTAQEFRGMAGKDFEALGIPTERAYLCRYCERTGRAEVDPAQWEFYLAYSMFRLAAILQGILKRSLDGTASSGQAEDTGRKGRVIAEAAWRQVDDLRGARA